MLQPVIDSEEWSTEADVILASILRFRRSNAMPCRRPLEYAGSYLSKKLGVVQHSPFECCPPLFYVVTRRLKRRLHAPRFVCMPKPCQ